MTEIGVLVEGCGYGRSVDGQIPESGGGREFQRVSDELRVRMTDGTYVQGSFLPSQRDLAEEFRVSRDTVQRALRELVDEGWIESRQGKTSGTAYYKLGFKRAGDALEIDYASRRMDVREQ